MEGVLGGTLRHLDYLLRFADQGEFDIHLAVSAERGPHVRDDFRRWQMAGWQVHEVPMRREICVLRDLRAARRMLALCRRERFHVVHTHCAKAGFLGRAAARLTGARTIHTPHVFPFSHDGGTMRQGLYLALERMAAGWTDRFVLLSSYQLNLMLQAGLGGVDRAVVVPNGIVPEDFVGTDMAEARRQIGLDPDRPVVLFAGRFREQKGLDVLLDATGLVAGDGPPVQVVILGEGPCQDWLQSQIASRGLGHMVHLHGLTDRMPLYYAACDLLVMPSRVEGMPYVLLEAKAAGRPTVASLVSGVEEFIEDGYDGFLVPPENPEALARTLRRALSDEALLDRTKAGARASFQDGWHARRSAERVYDLYRELA